MKFNAPAPFSPFDGVYIKYMVTNLIWTPHQHVIAHASAVFTADVGGKNVSCNPGDANAIGIPDSGWTMHDPKDPKSLLLQATRLSSTIMTCLMWYADVTKQTDYEKNIKCWTRIFTPMCLTHLQ